MSLSLNSEQQLAVESNAQFIAVIAGPGTGKTHTLSARIAHLLDTGIDPQKILALTFTTKVAKEINGYTFHSFAYYLLTKSGQKIKIVDELVQYQIVKKLVIKNVPQTILEISRFKSGLKVEDNIKFIVDIYNQELSRLGLVDYDDLILKSLSVAKDNLFKFILVDEFQDTNQTQYQLLQKLTGPKTSLFIIGDPRQSIYAFRGANALVFDQFIVDFQPQIINLATNYRSCPQVITTAQLLFPQDQPLTCPSPAGLVQTVKCPSLYSQANWILRFINQKLGGLDLNSTVINTTQDHHFSDFAILYRHHHQAVVLKKKFFDSGIPFQASSDDSEFGVLDPLADRVILSTIHAAKGLEFKYVFLFDFDNYLIDSDEDRRLLYVALTRAKRELYFLWSHQLPLFFPEIQKSVTSQKDPKLPRPFQKKLF